MGSLTNKAAIVAGGSGGIAPSSANGWQKKAQRLCVVHCGGHADAADEVVSKIKDKGGEAIAIQGNLSLREDVIKLFDLSAAAVWGDRYCRQQCGNGSRRFRC